MKTKITLRNDWHNTEVNLIVVNNKISESQMRRARRALCYVECICSGDFGTRGDQDGFGIEPIFDSWRGCVVGGIVHFTSEEIE